MKVIILNILAVLFPVVFIILIAFILPWIFIDIITPKFFLEKHRAVYDLDDAPLHIEVVECLKKYTIYRLDCNRGEFDTIVLNFWCPKWQSKKILKDLRQFKEVEVI